MLYAELEGEALETGCVLGKTNIYGLTGFKAFRVYWVLTVLSNRCDRNQSLGQPLEELDCWMCGLTLSVLRDKLGAGSILTIIWHCARGRDYGEKVS